LLIFSFVFRLVKNIDNDDDDDDDDDFILDFDALYISLLT